MIQACMTLPSQSDVPSVQHRPNEVFQDPAKCPPLKQPYAQNLGTLSNKTHCLNWCFAHPRTLPVTFRARQWEITCLCECGPEFSSQFWFRSISLAAGNPLFSAVPQASQDQHFRPIDICKNRPKTATKISRKSNFIHVWEKIPGKIRKILDTTSQNPWILVGKNTGVDFKIIIINLLINFPNKSCICSLLLLLVTHIQHQQGLRAPVLEDYVGEVQRVSMCVITPEERSLMNPGG